MKKYLLFLLLVCPLAVSYADRSYDKTGVFFCTTDLSPTAYGRLQQAFQTISKKSLIGAAVISSIGTTSILSGYYKIGIPMVAASGVGYASYTYFDNLFKEIKQTFESALNPNAPASSGSSSPHMNYVPIKKKTFDGEEGEIVSYKHCSILTAKYADIGEEDSLAVGDAEMKSFVQDAYRSTTAIERTGYKSPASVSSESLQPGTVCTLVKDFSVQKNVDMKLKMFKFFHKKADTTKYEVISNNCCTVAYDYVVDIGGDTTVIDRSNFNHGAGIEKRSLTDFAKHAGKHVLSFFVGDKGHLEDLDEKIVEESKEKEQECEKETAKDEL